MKKVLITCSGGAGAYSIRKALNGKYKIIAVDSNGMAEGLYRSENEKSFVVRNGNDDGYIDEILGICKSEEVDVVWPTSDEEISVISKNKELFEQANVKLVSSDHQTIKNATDKLRNCKLVKSLGITTPQSYELHEFEDKDLDLYPIIVRPKFGRGGKGVNFCRNKLEMKKLINILDNKSEYFVQEVINNSAGDMHMACAMFDRKSRLVSYFASRSIITQHKWGGCALGGIPVKNKKLKDIALEIFDKTGPWVGPVNIEFLWSKEEKDFYFIEINPRYWGYSSLVIEAGIDFPGMAVKIALGESVDEQFEYRTDVVTLPSREQVAYKLKDMKVEIPGILS